MGAPSWELYETFLAVMRSGSLSAASRALDVAQPTVRRRIEALEQALDSLLFTRASNGLVPTDAAQAILPYAESMGATARALTRSASGRTGAERGTVRLGTSEFVGGEVMPSILASLAERHPGIDIELALSNRNEDLLRRDVDVAVRMVAPTTAALVAKKVGVVPVGLFAAERYVARHGAPSSLKALREHALLGYDQQKGLIQALAALGLPLTPRDFRLRCDSDLALLAAVRAGVGIGACQLPRGEGLVRVLPKIAFPLDVWVATHEDLREVRRIRVVFDHLVKELGAYLATKPRRTPSG